MSAHFSMLVKNPEENRENLSPAPPGAKALQGWRRKGYGQVSWAILSLRVISIAFLEIHINLRHVFDSQQVWGLSADIFLVLHIYQSATSLIAC